MSVLNKFLKIETGRLFVCPDVHGMYEEFIAEMNRVNFNYDEDTLIMLGDLVDRGYDSLSCFNLTYKEYIYAVKGNHEQFCSDDNRECHISNGGQWFYDLPSDVQVEITRKVDELPITITVERKGKRYGFVHADIPKHINSWDTLLEQIENGDYTVIDTCIWGRSRYKTHGQLNIISDIDEVFVGHTIVKESIRSGNINFIDNGAFLPMYGLPGKLQFVEL